MHEARFGKPTPKNHNVNLKWTRPLPKLGHVLEKQLPIVLEIGYKTAVVFLNASPPK
jgi:hypothetical protein